MNYSTFVYHYSFPGVTPINLTSQYLKQIFRKHAHTKFNIKDITFTKLQPFKYIHPPYNKKKMKRENTNNYQER